ncbi:MAG TPA: transglycosylase family protein [Solirubrobacterales bacterium]|nr:transglycosylase family protein [Solirubrobacterales bacterium]
MRTQLKIGIVAAIALTGAAISGIALAGAADPDLETRIDSARQEATLVTERISSQSARIAELERSAAAARAREQDLEAELAESRARSAELGDELAAAETELEAVRARYKRAVDVLAEHLVAIYKSSEPDYLTILLEADGYDDLATRTDYLDALTAEDDRVAARVADLHEQVAGRHSEITELKAEIDRQTEQLEGARAEIAELRAEDERRAVQLSAARAEARAALGELQDRISGWELEVRREAAEQLASGGGEAFLGGPYAIPTYIVICESGGNYGALNPSSGAGGAYQILPSTWHAYGGSGLPHQASKAEQDRIAAIIWRQDGPGAWSCA